MTTGRINQVSNLNRQAAPERCIRRRLVDQENATKRTVAAKSSSASFPPDIPTKTLTKDKSKHELLSSSPLDLAFVMRVA